MRRSAPLLAGAILLHTAPLAAQVGLASVPRSVTLIATRLPSVSVTLPGGAAAKLGDVPIPVATSWSADPAEPVAVSLVAFVEAPGSAGASRSSVRLFTPPIPALEAGSGRGDGIQVRIDLIDRPDLIAGTYPRTLNLVAITQ